MHIFAIDRHIGSEDLTWASSKTALKLATALGFDQEKSLVLFNRKRDSGYEFV